MTKPTWKRLAPAPALARKGNVWATVNVNVGNVWAMDGVCAKFGWATHGPQMGNGWATINVSVGNVWATVRRRLDTMRCCAVGVHKGTRVRNGLLNLATNRDC